MAGSEAFAADQASLGLALDWCFHSLMRMAQHPDAHFIALPEALAGESSLDRDGRREGDASTQRETINALDDQLAATVAATRG